MKIKHNKKLANCHLPYFYENEKNNVYGWIVYNEQTNEPMLYNEIYEAMGDVVEMHFIFHYQLEENGTKILLHGHNLNEIIQKIYYYPESFQIPKEYQKDYSEQELKYLNKVQQYLLDSNLKDLEDTPEMQNLYNEFTKIYNMKNPKLKDKIKLYFLERQEKKLIEESKLKRSSYKKN